MSLRPISLLLLIAFLPFAGPSRAARGESPIVPAFERIFSEHTVDDEDELVEVKKGDPAHGGLLLFTELNCAACHGASNSIRSATKAAPVLTQAAARIKPDHLARYIADPQGVKKGATMPHILDLLPAGERAAAATAITHYLIQVAGGTPEQSLPRTGDGRRGDRLFHSVGCIACHDSRHEGDPTLPTSKPIGDPAAKYTLPSLTRFLLDPHAARPSGRMPALQLSLNEARSIAAYLLGLPETSTVSVSYYEGQWQKLPDFDKLEPVSVDGAEEIHIRYAKKKDHFGLRFEGVLQLAEEGEYTFYLKSDDGSRLTIDGKVVVDHDGVHGETEKNGKAKLAAGSHDVVVDVFELAGGELIQAEFQGPGVKRQPLHASMGAKVDSTELKSIAVEPVEELVATGRTLFQSLNCAACHELKEQGQSVAATVQAPKLSELKANRGCLAAKPSGKAVDYRLRESQRGAIHAMLAKQRESGAPKISTGHTLAAFNCYACHRRGGFGGVERARNGWFQGTIPEMGDEGRIPPHLDGIGAKLTDLWLDKILTEGAKDRPYMLARMPKFGKSNVGHMQAMFVAADRPKLESPPKVNFKIAEAEVKKIGRRLAGDKGFSCIKCHTFGRFPATGIQSIDLQLLGQRLRPEWTRQYLQNPQAFRPRTRMPSAWPLKGPSLLDAILEGDSTQQIAAVWSYLSDGRKARIPSGLNIKTLELIPIDEAIIYRNFIQGAGPRAIGVGYPESVNQAWDANELRLALLWQGRFIDASRHWSGRGQGFQGPAGEKILTAPPGVTIAALPSNDSPWPNESARELKYRFRGYRLSDEQRPTFLYEADGARVEERLETNANDPTVIAQRHFLVEAPNTEKRYWLRLAVGEIEKSDDGWYLIDSTWRTRIRSVQEILVRDSQGKRELLVPVAAGAATQIIQDFRW